MTQISRSLILILIRLLGVSSTLVAKRTRKNVSATPRVLIIRPDHLGDLVLTTPVLPALKIALNDVHITMLVGPWSKVVVERHPDVNRLISFPFPGLQRSSNKRRFTHISLFFLALRLRQDNYDLSVNLRPGFWWGAILSYIAGIPCRVGYDVQPATSFLTHVLPFQPPEHSVVSNLRLVSLAIQQLGFPPLDEPYTPEHYPLQFVPTEEEHMWIAQRLQEAGVNGESSVVVIHPGTGVTVKLWREEAWASCAEALRASFPNSQLVLSGSKNERPMLERIAQRIVPTPLLMTDMTVGQLAALLERAQIVLGVDSGPLHLAATRERPTIQIFGPTDPCIFGPWGPAERHYFVSSTQRCQTCPAIPCGRFNFSLEEETQHPCTRLVSEQAVKEAINVFCKVPLQI